MVGPPGNRRDGWLLALGIAVIAAVLRLYDLDSQLWLDEVSALRGYRTPFWETVTTFPGFFPNPLYELLAHASLRAFGASAWAIRLPAALFGIAGVLLFFKLARRLTGPAAGALAAALLAVSFHHIFYSQDARGYTTYLFFALLSTDLLLDLLERWQTRRAVGYALATALAAYAHPFGLFLLAGHVPVALFVAWSRRGGDDGDAASAWRILGLAATTGLVILALFAPLLGDAVTYAATEASTPGHGRQVFHLLPELLEGLVAGFGGWPGLVLGGVVGLLGTLSLMRRQPVALLLLVLPVLLSALAMSVLGAGVHPRYFIMALPIGYLVGTCGLVLVARWASERLLRSSPRSRLRLQVGLALLLVAAATVPLGRYYRYPKQDFLGALREVRERAAAGDRTVAAVHAGNGMRLYYDPSFPVADDLEELQEIENLGDRVWVITTLEREMAGHRPRVLEHLKREYERVLVLPGTVGDGAMRIYVRAGRRAASPVSGH